MNQGNRHLLTPEQLKVVERWDRERVERQRLYKKLEAEINNPAAILQELQELEPDFCEHGRYILGVCSSCDEIERILFPDLFESENG
jgi:hypothetical protein